MPEIRYSVEPNLTVDEFTDLLQRSTLAERRPVNDPQRISRMLSGATIIVTARHEQKLVGVSRCISDGAYCTYLSDLAVDENYQRQGIGKELIRQSREKAGPQATLILLAAPKARSYYGHVGMEPHDSCWILPPGTIIPDNAPKIEVVSGASATAAPLRSETPSLDKAAEIEGFFDSLSDDYALAIRRCVPRYDEMLWALFRYIPARIRGAIRILELGCGTGNLTLAIRERFPDAKITAVDLSHQSLEICRNRHGDKGELNAVQADMRRLEFEPDSFDLILSTIAIHHLTSEEKQQLFQQCNGWLTDNGVFSYTDQFSGSDSEFYEVHMREWQKATQEAGATAEEWAMWMEHQDAHDHHDSLSDQIEWLERARFSRVDCVWRHLLWTVLTATKLPIEV